MASVKCVLVFASSRLLPRTRLGKRERELVAGEEKKGGSLARLSLRAASPVASVSRPFRSLCLRQGIDLPRSLALSRELLSQEMLFLAVEISLPTTRSFYTNAGPNN